MWFVLFRTLLIVLFLELALCHVHSAPALTFFPTNTSWKYFKGTSEASAPDSAAWRSLAFNDSSWATGNAAFYYGVSSSGTLLDDMSGNYSSVFFRKNFIVTNAHEFDRLILGASTDDGCIAWLNEVEVARYNVSKGFVPYNGFALESFAPPILFNVYAISNASSLLVPGTNVLAFQSFNFIIDSGDFLFTASLTALPDTNAPAVASLLPPAGSVVRSLASVQIKFSEAVTNVDSGDLRVNGIGATNLIVLSPSEYRFEFPPPTNGPVSFDFAPGHGIRDLAPAQNSFAGSVWTVLLDPNAPLAQVRISEFMAANVASTNDDDGDFSDWIELQNFGTNSVSLLNWSLTDDPALPGKWRFPAVTLSAGRFALVWASGKNRAVANAPLHTNFKLDRGGGYLALLDGDTNVLSIFNPYPSQLPDISYGIASSTNSYGYFASPTPGATNGTQFAGRTDSPEFSHNRGFYETNFSLVLTSQTAGAQIYFTMNGTTPMPSNGVVYTTPLLISNTIALRAAAFAPGLLQSSIRTHTFLFARDIIRQPDGVPPPGWPTDWGNNVVDYGMDPNVVNDSAYSSRIQADLRAMPSLSIVMDLDDLFDATRGIYANAIEDGIAWERPTSLELINTNGADGFQEQAGIRIRGGFSRASNDPKHSFKFFFREEYGAGKLNFPMFGPTGAASFDKFDLRTAQDGSYAFLGDANGTFLADLYARSTQGALGQPYTRGNFYHLYINGIYWGVYNTEERAEASYGATYFGGVQEDYDVVRVEFGAFDVTATDGDLGAWRRLWQAATNGFVNNADYEKVQGNNPDGTPNPNFEVLVDMDNLIDYMLLTIYVGNFDGPVWQDNAPNNFFAIRNRNTREGFRFFEHDAELSLSDVNFDRTIPITVGDPAAGSSFSESNPQYIWQRLWANAEFRLRTADHVQKFFFNGGPLTPDACVARYAARTNELSRGMVGESARWGDAQREPPIVHEDWVNAVSGVLNDYLPYRSAIVLNQLRNRGLYPLLAAPQFNQPGGSVPAAFAVTLSHTNASGTIWYTLNSSDPRTRGGGVSGSAISYSTPIVVNTPTVVRARVKDGANWSALMEATFYPPQDLSGLQISEIMYNPPFFGLVDGDEVEFLEFKNAGVSTIDVTGLRFSAGINFGFTNNTTLLPGSFFVLARNPVQFAAKYPGVTINGLYSGKLDNSGETLRLVTALSNVVLSITYDDASPWPLTADGLGFSLVPSGAAPADPSSAMHWRSSTNPGGSPGTDDPVSQIPTVLVNEVLSRPVLPGLDTVELFNPTTNTVDVTGWFLTDDASVPMKYRFPSNSLIAPNGFVVVDESQFNPTPGTNASFSFGLRGDDVLLFSGDANSTNLTGYSHGFSFGGSAEGISYGRFVNSAGEEQFVPQISASFHGTNTGPSFGPVVINEINYHPALEHDEFIELRNLSNAAVDLFDPAHATNAWRLNGAGFTFPQGTTLAPNSYALITSLSPAAFRSKYSVPGSILIFGPLAGFLQDSGERLELQRPETPDTNGIVWVAVDAVRYNDKPPWPSGADGDGPSLQRLNSFAYGDDPSNWFASGITPGTANSFNQAPVVALTSPANGESFYAPTDLTLSADAYDSDGSITRVEFFDSGAKIGEKTTAPYSFVWTNVAIGTHSLTAKARDNGLAVTESAAITVTVRQPILVDYTLLPLGSVWRYFDKGQDLGTNWVLPAYNDSSWATGPAELGYGDNDEATVVGYGLDPDHKFTTTYFRRTFFNPVPYPFWKLTMTMRRDDGIIVWLNGAEIFRDNMPTGEVFYGTQASSALGPPLENELIFTNLAPNLLAIGTNVLAVEIHQGAPDSSDLSFDLALTAKLIQPSPELSLQGSGTDRFNLRWPALAGSYQLEQTTNLTPPIAWSPVTNSIANDGYWKSLAITNLPAAGARFFRLNAL